MEWNEDVGWGIFNREWMRLWLREGKTLFFVGHFGAFCGFSLIFLGFIQTHQTEPTYRLTFLVIYGNIPALSHKPMSRLCLCLDRNFF